MGIERPAAGLGVESVAGATPARTPDSEAIQILATEHWSLLATRSMTWNESFSRTGMFFTVLSGATVALALIAQATSFSSQFAVFALVLLPVVLFVGLATFFRLVDVNNEDARWVIAMNRIRAAYLKRRPDLAEYFTTSPYDDFAGVSQTFTGDGNPARSSGLGFVLHGFITTPSTLGAVVSAVAGVLAGTIALQLGGTPGSAILVGGVAFVLVFGLLFFYQYRVFTTGIAGHVPRFPTPPAPMA